MLFILYFFEISSYFSQESDLSHLNEEERNLLRKLRIEESGPVETGRAPRGRKKKQPNKSPEVMAQRRRKIWSVMAKKELGKV